MQSEKGKEVTDDELALIEAVREERLLVNMRNDAKVQFDKCGELLWRNAMAQQAIKKRIGIDGFGTFNLDEYSRG